MVIETLGLVGITMIATGSYILIPVRERIGSINKHLAYYVCCPQCVGFLVGLVAGFYEDYALKNSVYLAGAISFLSYFSDSLVLMINRAFTKE